MRRPQDQHPIAAFRFTLSKISTIKKIVVFAFITVFIAKVIVFVLLLF